MITLRPYQNDLMEETRAVLREGVKSVVLCLATGGGKTAIAATIFKNSTSKGKRCWFINHRREILAQSAATFDSVGVPFGYVAAGLPMDRVQLAQLISVDTLRHRFELLPTPDVVVWDEGHHIGAMTWAKLREALPNAIHIALTATPERLDGKGLGAWFEKIICGPSVAWLIDNGFLSKYRLFSPKPPSLEGVHKRHGDYATNEVEEIMDKPTITGSAVDHYRNHAHGKRALVRCVSVKHSQHVCDQFRRAGYSAEHVDGSTPLAIRDAAMGKFRRGEIQVLTQCDILNEGLDIRGIQCAIDLRPTQSLTLWLQFCGRALRPDDGKAEAIILDAAGNARRHGLPDDAREWSLEGSKGAAKESESDGPKVKTCPMCFAAVASYKPVCKHCGHVFQVGIGRTVEQRDGELAEVDLVAARGMRRADVDAAELEVRAKTMDDLIRIGRLRGYRRPELWANFVFRARAAKRAKGEAHVAHTLSGEG